MPDFGLLRCRPRPFGRTWRAGLLALAIALFLIQPAAANPRYAALVIDAKTGETLFSRHADEPRYPASLTKMMTLYLLFEELEAGRLTLDSKLSVSAHAASRPPTKLGVRAGSTLRVEDAIRALCVRSANDVAVVVAENIEGSVGAFAERMTRTARAIGMHHTTFRNPHGLPNSEQKTTARDLALLAQALMDRYPRYFEYFNTRSFTYKGRRYRNTNRLLGKVRGMDGIKTGYIRASGFNLVTHVERDGREIVAVVMGGRTSRSRNAHMVELINDYLPKASRGPRTAPLVSVQLMTPAPTPRARPVEADDAATAVAELVRGPAQAALKPAVLTSEPTQPAPRPDQSAPQPFPAQAAAQPLLAYALVPMARPAAQGGTAAARRDDPIAARIARANEVADLAYAAQALSDGEALAKLAAMAALSAPEAQAKLESADQELEPARAGPERKAADAQPETESVPGGWQIQIAAVPDEDGARALLERARKRAGKLLAQAMPYTEQVESKGTVYYRARFAGFEGKDEARAVCAKLKRKSIDCLALPN